MITTGFNWLKDFGLILQKRGKFRGSCSVETHGGFSLRLDIRLQK